jgi:hypothetical protein
VNLPTKFKIRTTLGQIVNVIYDFTAENYLIFWENGCMAKISISGLHRRLKSNIWKIVKDPWKDRVKRMINA